LTPDNLQPVTPFAAGQLIPMAKLLFVLKARAQAGIAEQKI
jgi:hypothetical protein